MRTRYLLYMELTELLDFDPGAPDFLLDPYPDLNRVREHARVFYDAGRERWFVTRHDDVRSCLRDRRLGRNFRHVLSPDAIGSPPLDPRWQAFWDSERWSLLWLEPPDHTRLRKLVAAAFTPRSVESLREPAHDLARELLEPLAEAGEMELLYDYAQPYSIAVICRMLGVPLARHPEQWQRVASGEVAPQAASEEMIRFDPPLQLFERWVLADDFAIGDVSIPLGSKLALLFGAANRDPRVFERPDEFDVGRPNAAQHIGFGGGIHVCIGAPLARVELEASVAALRRYWPDFDLAEEPRRTGAFVIWGLEGLRLARR